MRHAVEPPSGIADVTTLYPLKRAEAGGIQLGVSTRYNGAQKRRVCTAAETRRSGIRFCTSRYALA